MVARSGERGQAGQGHQVTEELEPKIHPIKSGRQREVGPHELRLQAPGHALLTCQISLRKQKFKDKIIKNFGIDYRA